VLVITDHGSRQLLSLALRGEAAEEWNGELTMYLIDAQPPVSSTKIALSDYSTRNDTDPVGHDIEQDDWSVPIIEDGRALSQIGPPSLKWECPTAFTLYGHLFADDDDLVWWVEVYETPQEVAAAGDVQIIPALRAWGTGPPT
jgi:hypothetical protein